MTKHPRSEAYANRQLAEGKRKSRNPNHWPRAARPTWGTMETTGKPLWQWKLSHE